MKWSGLLAGLALSACSAGAEKEQEQGAQDEQAGEDTAPVNVDAFVDAARKAEESGNWSAAYKGYAEADLASPSAEHKLGAALALAKMDRDADGCENDYAVKESDLTQAKDLLAKAKEGAEVTVRAAEVETAVAQAEVDMVAARVACPN